MVYSKNKQGVHAQWLMSFWDFHYSWFIKCVEKRWCSILKTDLAWSMKVSSIGSTKPDFNSISVKSPYSLPFLCMLRLTQGNHWFALTRCTFVKNFLSVPLNPTSSFWDILLIKQRTEPAHKKRCEHDYPLSFSSR